MSDALQGVSQRMAAPIRTMTKFEGVRVYSSVNVDVPHATNTIVPFNAERFDDAGLHSTSANTSRITVVAAARYIIGATFLFNNDPTGHRQINLLVNGATLIAIQGTNASSELSTPLNVETIYELVPGDYVELMVYQSSVAGMAVAPATAYSAELWLYRIS